jgi:hypothetical protein
MIWNRIVVLAILLLILQGCNSDRISSDQEELHSKVHQSYQQAFDDFEAEIENSAKLIEGCVDQSKKCSASASVPAVSDQVSSLYVPDFSPKGSALRHFKELSMPLEVNWDDFLKNHPYVSWLYVFDVTSGALRIAPATPTELTFGASMDFKNLEFFEAASREYPKVAWQKKTKQDLSGTGLILMASRSVRNHKGEVSQVVSGDVKVSYMAKAVQPLFDQFITKTRSKGFHFFAYLKPTHHFRSPISEYASDQAEWLSIKAFSNYDDEFLHVNPVTQAKLLSIEERATRLDPAPLNSTTKTPSFITGRVHLGDAPYHCSVSQLRKPQVLLWICAR